MLFPDALYRRTSRDIGQPWARIYVPPVLFVFPASAVVDPSLRAPGDQCVILTNITASFLPGAAQTLTEAMVDTGPALATMARIASFIPPVGLPANTTSTFNWQGEVVIPPSWFIRCRAVFNAGAAANVVICQLMGMSLPLGSIQLP